MPEKRKRLRSQKDLDREFEGLLRLASRLSKKRPRRSAPKPIRRPVVQVSLAAR